MSNSIASKLRQTPHKTFAALAENKWRLTLFDGLKRGVPQEQVVDVHYLDTSTAGEFMYEIINRSAELDKVPCLILLDYTVLAPYMTADDPTLKFPHWLAELHLRNGGRLYAWLGGEITVCHFSNHTPKASRPIRCSAEGVLVKEWFLLNVVNYTDRSDPDHLRSIRMAVFADPPFWKRADEYTWHAEMLEKLYQKRQPPKAQSENEYRRTRGGEWGGFTWEWRTDDPFADHFRDFFYREQARRYKREHGFSQGAQPAPHMGAQPQTAALLLRQRMDYALARKILGLNGRSDPDTLKKAYREKARQFHPDVNQEPDAQDWMKLVNIAYAYLKE